MPHWQKVVRSLAWVALILVLTRIGLQVAILSVTSPAGAEGEKPAAVFDVRQQEVLVGPEDTDVSARFPVHNVGQRRLVVRYLRRACCDPPAPEPLILNPGEKGEVTVQAPAAQLLEQGEIRRGFGTNDPRQPEVWLTIALANQPTPAERPRPETAAASPSRSVLVNKP